APERGAALVALGREPLAVLLHLLARVHRRHGRGNPARLQRVRGIGAGADQVQAEVLAGLHQGCLHVLAMLPGSEQLESRLPGHPGPTGVPAPPASGDLLHFKDLQLGCFLADPLPLVLRGVRPWYWKPILPAPPRGAGPPTGALAPLEHDVETAGLRVELHP